MHDYDNRIMVLVHPGSACGSADFNLGDASAAARNALAREIMAWEHDLFVIDGELSDELIHYPAMGIALESAADRDDRRIVRQIACDLTVEDWPNVVAQRFATDWPGGPHHVHVTGAWVHGDGSGCVNTVAEIMSSHKVTISGTALRLP